MKIAYITNALSATGGVGKYSRSLASAFSALGHDVLVIHEDSSVNKETLPFKTCYLPQYSTYSPKGNAKTKDAIEAIQTFAPDIVHVQASMNYALEHDIRKSYATLKSLHVYDFCPSGTKYHYAAKKNCIHKPGFLCIPRMIFKRCTHDRNPSTLWMFYKRAKESHKNDIQYKKMIVASNYVRDQALQIGYQDFQLEVIPYFTSIPKVVSEVPSTDKVKIFMATGRMVAEKGFDKLLEAAANMKHERGWKIIFDGDGQELCRLKEMARRLELERCVEFPGWLPANEHAQLYQKAYAVIVPSVWPEPFGLVGIEAMSYAKPVIAFQSGGIHDWLDNGKNGYSVPTGDIRLLAEKMLYLLQHPEIAASMGQRGFEMASAQYQESRHLERLLKLYDEIRSNHIFISNRKSSTSADILPSRRTP